MCLVCVRMSPPTERSFNLAPRLAIGIPPWRDLQLWIATVQKLDYGEY